MSNPLDLMFCWQALLQALVVGALMQFIKVIVDLNWPPKTARAKYIRKRLIYPVLVTLVGAACAVLIPARPDVLVAYAEAHITGKYPANMLYAAWGVCIGQVADHIRTKALGAIRDLKLQAPTGASPASDPPPPPDAAA